MAVTFSTQFANKLLQCLTYDANVWDTLLSPGSPLAYNTSAYLVLMSGTGYDFSTNATTDGDVIAYSNSAIWTPSSAGVKRGTYTFSSVAHAGVPAEAQFATIQTGSIYPTVTGDVTISGGGGMVIGSVASYSSGNRNYVTNIYIPPDNGGTLRFGTALRNAIADKMVAGGVDLGLFDGGSLQFYDGTQPTSADTAVTTQTLLATATLSSAPWGSASSRSVSNASTIATAAAVASGTATWARLTKSTYIMDFGVGALVGDIIVPSAFTSGQVKTLSVGAITLSFP